MSFHVPAGYTPGAGDRPLTHARIAHGGNWVSGVVSASSTDGGGIYQAEAPANSLTFERWRPAALPATWGVSLAAPTVCDYCVIAADDIARTGGRIRAQSLAFNRTNYALQSGTMSGVASTGLDYLGQDASPDGTGRAALFSSAVSAGPHFASFTVPGGSFPPGSSVVFSIYVKRSASGGVRISFADLAGSADFDLAAMSASATGAQAAGVFPAPGGFVRLWIRLAVSDGSADLVARVSLISGGSDVYAGRASDMVSLWGPQCENESLEPTSFVETSGSPVSSFYHDLSDWVSPGYGPTFLAFRPVSASAFRVEFAGAERPAVGFVRFGRSLQMEERTRYAGRIPFALAEQKLTTASQSVRGEFLSRMTLRAGLPLSFMWAHLSEGFTTSEVALFLSSIASDVFVIAERPGTHPDDVALCWTSEGVPRPMASGLMDLHDFDLQCEGYVSNE